MFGFIKNTFNNFFSNLGSRLKNLFTSDATNKLNFLELEKLLLESDIGIEITQKLITKIKSKNEVNAFDFNSLKDELERELLNILAQCKPIDTEPEILMLVGVNGAGKTTFAAKLANYFKEQGKKPLLVAGDTFRAAAKDQLFAWTEKIKLDLIQGNENQDAASVVFLGAEKFLQESFNSMVIDTAGRLHTKVNLMQELQKIKKVLTKKLGDAKQVSTWLVVDAMLGQSSLSQAEIFNNATELDGIVLTKCDGAAKGGIIFAIAEKFKLPVVFLSRGQNVNDLVVFNAQQFVHDFLN